MIDADIEANPADPPARDEAKLLRLAEEVLAAERAYDRAEASGRETDDELDRLIRVEAVMRRQLAGAMLEAGASVLEMPDGTIITWTLQSDGMEVVGPEAVVRPGGQS